MDIGDLSEKEKRDLYAAVRRAAFAIARSNDIAKELTQEAFLLQATTRPWKQDSGIPLARHLIGIVQSVWSTQAASYVARIEREREFASGEALVADGAEGDSVEVKLLALAGRKDAERRAKQCLAKLSAKLERLGLSLDLEIVEWMAKGVTKTEDLVERTGGPPGEVKTALARIRRHLKTIVAERGHTDDQESNDAKGDERAEGDLS